MIFIPYNVPSSKNNRRNFGRYSIASKATIEYIKATERIYKDNTNTFLELIKDKPKPYIIGLHFVRKSKHKWDFINPCQTVADILTKMNWIEDDNMDEVIFVPFKINDKYYTYDKDNPGVYIKIIE